MIHTIPQEEIEEAVEKTTLDLEVEEIFAEAILNGLLPKPVSKPSQSDYTGLKDISNHIQSAEEIFLTGDDVFYLATNFADLRRLEQFRDAVMANPRLFQYQMQMQELPKPEVPSTQPSSQTEYYANPN